MEEQFLARRWNLWLYGLVGVAGILLLEVYRTGTLPGPLNLYPAIILLAAVSGGARVGAPVLLLALAHAVLRYVVDSPYRAPGGGWGDVAVMAFGGAAVLACGALIGEWHRYQVTRVRNSRSVLEAFLDAVPVGLFVVDPKGRPFYVNRTSRELLGRGIDGAVVPGSLAQVYGAYVAGTDTPYDDQRIPIMSALRGETDTVDDIEVRRPDGSRVQLQVGGAPVLDEDGDIAFGVAAFWDITERRLAEQALNATFNWVSDVVQNAPVAIYALDEVSEHVTLWNPAAERLFGWSTAEVLGRPLPTIPETERPSRGLLLRDLAAERRLVGRELRRLRKDGSLCDISMSATLQPSMDGARTELLAFSEDTTARKQAERELAESREAYRQLVDEATDIVFRTDVNGRFTYVNPVAVRITGFSEAELLSKRFVDLIAASHKTQVARFYYRQYIDRRPTTYLEFPMVTADGAETWRGQNTTLLLDAAGEPRGFQAIVRDITERRNAELALAKQLEAVEAARRDLRVVVDSAEVAMLLVAPDGHVALANDTLDGLFPEVEAAVRAGEPALAITDRIAGDLTDSREFAAWCQSSLSNGHQAATEVLQLQPVERTLVARCRPLDGASGELQGHLLTFRDVTQERELERMKDQFVSMVSHELRTPLTSMIGYSELLMEGVPGPLNDNQERYLRVVHSSALRQLTLVNDLLDLSRLSEGRLTVTPATVSMGATIAAVVGALQPQSDAKGQTVRFTPPAEPVTAWADEARLTQVLTNLLSNAIKYTPNGGSVELRVQRVADGVQVDVADTGIGLTAEEQAKVFSRFFRSANPAAQAAGGTGLGLAITKALVEVQGGHIWFTSEPGAGTTFSFTLPATGPTTA